MLPLPWIRFAIPGRRSNLRAMLSAFEFLLPSSSKTVPTGPDWIHEIKYDGYRLRLERDHDRVRLITRGGHDWTKCFSWIVESALRNREPRFVIDGEAVLLGVDGISDFNALHSRKHDHEVQLYAFDILAMGGDDLRPLPLHLRKTNLERLLARRPDGITIAPFERGEIGPDLFRAACRMGLEGLVSKHRDRPYRGGRQKYWIKVKNRSHPAMEREL
ncbi:bifunctional non-homologous end joining protein LigD [Bradyrhizobium diazoefficiens]